MIEFEFKKKTLTHLLFDGKIDIAFFHSQMDELQKNNGKRMQNDSYFIDVNHKPDTHGHRPAVMSKKRKGNF